MPEPVQESRQQPAVSVHGRLGPPVPFDGPGSFTAAHVDAYEAGVLLVSPGFRLCLSRDEWGLLDSFDAPAVQDNWFKKAKLSALLAGFGDGDFSKHVLGPLLPGRPQDARRLQTVIARVTDALRAAARLMFPAYRFVGENITWRLTRTEIEAMHFDSYGDSVDDLHYVRLFVNLDSLPRLWSVSYLATRAVEIYAERCRGCFGQHPNLMNAHINKVVPWGEFPRTLVAFAPGNVWLVNSQLASHEIVFGRKMVACTFNVEPDSMRDPTRSFPSAMRRVVKELSRADS